MSHWAEAFAALSRDYDTLDTTRHSGGGTSFVSQTVKSVTRPPAPPKSSTPRAPDSVAVGWTECIRTLRCPEDFSPERWERLKAGALRFAAEWGAQALRLGWSLDELFKIAEPFANVSLQGAAWFIGNSTAIDVTAAAITLLTASGVTQRFYRRSLQ